MPAIVRIARRTLIAVAVSCTAFAASLASCSIGDLNEQGKTCTGSKCPSGLPCNGGICGGPVTFPDAGDTSLPGDSTGLETAGPDRIPPDGALDVEGLDEGAPVEIRFVQAAAGFAYGVHQDVAVTTDSPQSPGDMNVVAIACYDSLTCKVQSISDTNGNTYKVALAPLETAPLFWQSVLYSMPIDGGTFPNTITATLSGDGGTDMDMRVVEYSGLRTGLVGAANNSGNGTEASAGPLMTTTPALLVAATVAQYAAPRLVPTPPFVAAVNTSGSGNGSIDDLIVLGAGHGTYTANASQPEAGAWLMQLAAFR